MFSICRNIFDLYSRRSIYLCSIYFLHYNSLHNAIVFVIIACLSGTLTEFPGMGIERYNINVKNLA